MVGIPQLGGVMPSPNQTYALILAGGSGTRFWPLSRNSCPKQLLDLFGSGTLLEQTIRRLDGLVPLEQIFVLTNEKQVDAVRAAAPMLPAAIDFSSASSKSAATGSGRAEGRDTMQMMPHMYYRLPRSAKTLDHTGCQALCHAICGFFKLSLNHHSH